MPWKENTRMSLRLEFVTLAHAEKVNISRLCKQFKISRKTGYKWLRRYLDEGPSPEEQAATSVALTASAATNTPTITPTSTPTFTPTPVPYDLNVLVKGEEDAIIVGANVVLAEAGEDSSSQITDDIGQAFWNDLPGETVNLSISAQGYLPQDTSVTIERGPNQFTITLEQDPFGMLPSEACSPGESLIYIEDFQDNEAAGWQEINYHALGWGLMPHPETPEDIVARHDGSQTSSTLLEGSDLDNAVWRGWFNLTGIGEYFLMWDWADPTTVEGGDFSAYQMDSSSGGSAHNVFALYRVVWPSFHLTVSQVYQRIEENVWHKFEVSYYDGRVEVWVDNILWFAYQDPHPLPSGMVGLEVRPYRNEDFEIYFDDFSIYKLDAPFAPMPTPES